MKKRDKMGEALFREEEERLCCFNLEKTVLDGVNVGCGEEGMPRLEEQNYTEFIVLVRGGCVTDVHRVIWKGKIE